MPSPSVRPRRNGSPAMEAGGVRERICPGSRFDRSSWCRWRTTTCKGAVSGIRRSFVAGDRTSRRASVRSRSLKWCRRMNWRRSSSQDVERREERSLTAEDAENAEDNRTTGQQDNKEQERTKEQQGQQSVSLKN